LNEALVLPINRYAIVGSTKSILIDTGAPEMAQDTVEAVSQITDIEKLDYIFVTHADMDHAGGVLEVLKHAPKARILSNMTMMGKSTSMYGFPMERFAILFPGEEIDLGDRKLRVSDSFIEDGHTNWLFDTKTHTFYTSDAFGSVQFGKPAPQFADQNPVEAHAQGFAIWQHMNFNMMPKVDVKKFQEALNRMQRLEVQEIASVHGPVIRRDLVQAYELMEAMPTAEVPPPPPLPSFLRLS
jgi:flavorubredoxin